MCFPFGLVCIQHITYHLSDGKSAECFLWPNRKIKPSAPQIEFIWKATNRRHHPELDLIVVEDEKIVIGSPPCILIFGIGKMHSNTLASNYYYYTSISKVAPIKVSPKKTQTLCQAQNFLNISIFYPNPFKEKF